MHEEVSYMWYTRFIFYKNHVEAQKCLFFKNIVVVSLVAISISFDIFRRLSKFRGISKRTGGKQIQDFRIRQEFNQSMNYSIGPSFRRIFVQTDLFVRQSMLAESILCDLSTLPSIGVDWILQGESGSWARAERDILSQCVHIPTHPVSPDPPRLTVVNLWVTNFI